MSAAPMITDDMIEARRDFMKHFANGDDPIVTREMFGGEEVIIVQNKYTKAIYARALNSRVELVRVEKLKEK